MMAGKPSKPVMPSAGAPLAVAAGAFGRPQTVAAEDDWEWVEVDSARRLRAGMFVAQVAGRSMEPLVPDGAYALFRAPVEGTRQGKTVLVQLRGAVDPETGARYTLKRYDSERVAAGESWRHARITLKPANPEFAPIVLTAADEGDLTVVAELVEVLTATPARSRIHAVDTCLIRRYSVRRARSRRQTQCAVLSFSRRSS